MLVMATWARASRTRRDDPARLSHKAVTGRQRIAMTPAAPAYTIALSIRFARRIRA